MIDGSEKRNRQLAFELQNSHVCEKRSKQSSGPGNYLDLRETGLFPKFDAIYRRFSTREVLKSISGPQLDTITSSVTKGYLSQTWRILVQDY